MGFGKLFDIPDEPKKETPKKTRTNLKKGQTINDLIETAKRIVEEKLGDYKDVSKCIMNPQELQQFFDNTPENAEIGIDTETTGLDYLEDRMVGISLCNGRDCLYIPVSHMSVAYNKLVPGQIQEEDLKRIFNNAFNERKFKWVFHNAKFDLGVMRTYFGYKLPDPYWDTMLVGFLLNQDEEHSLKYLYNKYIAEEDEGVNRFDTLFKGITFDNVPLDIATIYAGKDALMTYKLYLYQKELLEKPEYKGLKYVYENIEMPLLPILEDMYRYGVNMNKDMLNKLYEKYNERLLNAQEIVYSEINKYKDKIDDFRAFNLKGSKLDDPIKISSPAQLSILFYDILGYKIKGDKKGTGVNELKEINTPLTNALLEYRKMEKLIDAFLVALPKRLGKSDNKIHTNLNQYGAATGRFSSSGPKCELGHMSVMIYEKQCEIRETYAIA